MCLCIIKYLLPNCFPQSLYQFTLPQWEERTSFPTTLQTLDIIYRPPQFDPFGVLICLSRVIRDVEPFLTCSWYNLWGELPVCICVSEEEIQLHLTKRMMSSWLEWIYIHVLRPVSSVNKDTHLSREMVYLGQM